MNQRVQSFCPVMRCMRSSQTADRLLLVFGFVWQLVVRNMEEGTTGIRLRGGSKGGEQDGDEGDVMGPFASFSSAGHLDLDVFLEEDHNAETSSSSLPIQSRSSLDPLDLGAVWEDSQCEGVPLEMKSALSQALSSRSLTPLLKEELRCKIQLKRLQHGQDEIAADFSVRGSAMSLDEIVKKNKKMEQNRMSAQRSRERRKSLEKTMKSRLEQLRKQNNLLAEEVKSLRHACKVAQDWLNQHRTCPQHVRNPVSDESSSRLIVGSPLDSKSPVVTYSTSK